MDHNDYAVQSSQSRLVDLSHVLKLAHFPCTINQYIMINTILKHYFAKLPWLMPVAVGIEVKMAIGGSKDIKDLRRQMREGHAPLLFARISVVPLQNCSVTTGRSK